jgi:phosphinothricin acetyltransferase
MVIDDLDTSYAVDGLEAYTGRSYRRCMIRLATPADAEGIARIYDPVVSGTAISFEVDPPGPGEMERRIRETLELTPWLVEASEDGVRGYAYASRHRDRAAYRWSADVAVYVRGDQRRLGIGRALYATLFALLRLQGFHAAHAGITLPNAASVALHESVGFRPVGVYPAVGYKLGAWRDVGWWQLELRARSSAPGPLRRVPELRADPAWISVLSAGAGDRSVLGGETT